jgi:hypothetical protein
MPTQTKVHCRGCGANTAVSFGPYGFIAECPGQCQLENLDLDMEPIWFAEVTPLFDSNFDPDKYVGAA